MADTDPIKRAQALITELNKAYQVCKQATADDIRAFLPRSVRNVENAEARLRAAL